jgi:hypothetical protein
MLSLAIDPSLQVLPRLQVGDIVPPIDSFILIGHQFVGGMLLMGFAGY